MLAYFTVDNGQSTAFSQESVTDSQLLAFVDAIEADTAVNSSVPLDAASKSHCAFVCI